MPLRTIPSRVLLSLTVAVACGTAACGSTVQARSPLQGSSDGLSVPGVGNGAGGTGAGLDGSGGQVPGAAASPPGAVGTGATGGGPAGSGGSTRSSTTTVVGAPPGLATSGPGWDAKSVYFGVPTEEDLSKTLSTLGISLDPGSLQADINAISADLNDRGGLFGRKLVPVFHDNRAADVAGNRENTAQANCSAFTQDRHVVSVLDGIILTESFMRCMKSAHTPLLSIGYSTLNDEDYRTFGPTLYTTLMPNVSHFVPLYVPALEQAGFFGGWDTTLGKSTTAPAVVGILEPDTKSGHSTAALHLTALRKAGIKVGQQYFYREDASAYGTDMSAAVLSFRNAGVTHVLDITDLAVPLLFFARTAQQQQYFPRYGMTSWLNPQSAADIFAQGGASQQLNGSVGIGWTPGADVNLAHDPGETPPQRACREALARHGVSYTPDKQRFALMIAWALCDDVKLLVAAAQRGGGLSPEAIGVGMESVQNAFTPAVTFSSALSPSNHVVPGSYRVITFDGGCTCFAYTGPQRRLS